MDFEDEIEICAELMAKDYKIPYWTARRIINSFDMEDAVREYYQEEIAEADEAQRAEWREEMTQFPYNGDIHGGI